MNINNNNNNNIVTINYLGCNFLKLLIFFIFQKNTKLKIKNVLKHTFFI